MIENCEPIVNSVPVQLSWSVFAVFNILWGGGNSFEAAVIHLQMFDPKEWKIVDKFANEWAKAWRFQNEWQHYCYH